MNIGSKLLAAGLFVGLVGCSTEETVYVDNMDKDAKAALATAVRHAGFELADVKVTKLPWITSRRRPSTRSNSRRAGTNTNLTSMPSPGAS